MRLLLALSATLDHRQVVGVVNECTACTAKALFHLVVVEDCLSDHVNSPQGQLTTANCLLGSIVPNKSFLCVFVSDPLKETDDLNGFVVVSPLRRKKELSSSLRMKDLNFKIAPFYFIFSPPTLSSRSVLGLSACLSACLFWLGCCFYSVRPSTFSSLFDIRYLLLLSCYFLLLFSRLALRLLTDEKYNFSVRGFQCKCSAL